MKSPFSLLNVLGFLLINILVSAITTWVVVRTLIPPIAQAAPQAIATPATTPVAPALAVATDNAATPTASTGLPATATAQPQLTVAPANASSKGKVDVRISSVTYAGQLSREVVIMVNEGEQVDMTGWQIVPPRGKVYTFGQVVMFKNSFINLHTTSGADVPNDLYWGLNEPMWQSGDEVKLLRKDGSTAATLTVK